MSNIPVEKDPYLGPSQHGMWMQTIPEHTEFQGCVNGIPGRFWKSSHEVRELLNNGRGREWGYWRQIGIWVENYLCLNRN